MLVFTVLTRNVYWKSSNQPPPHISGTIRVRYTFHKMNDFYKYHYIWLHLKLEFHSIALLYGNEICHSFKNQYKNQNYFYADVIP